MCCSAFNAIVSSSVVMLDIAYGIPIAINCMRGRNMIPERHFVLPNVVGWIANMVCSMGAIIGWVAFANHFDRFLWPISR